MDIAFMIDVSGSMLPQDIRDAKEMMRQVTSRFIISSTGKFYLKSTANGRFPWTSSVDPPVRSQFVLGRGVRGGGGGEEIHVEGRGSSPTLLGV